MAVFNLNELLENKELCKEVIAENITVYDENGVFEALDFESNSMRSNHINTFEQLYAIGGDELFEEILKSGKTCLANSPDAAKVGVVAIDGADGYYLKANANSLTAFRSILNALSIAGECANGFDAETIFVSYGEENSDDEEYEIPVAKNYSIQMINNKFVIVDNDSGNPVTLKYDLWGRENEFDGMCIIESILFEKETEDEFDDILSDDDIPDGELLGYRYKVEATDDWGFISKSFLQVTPPYYKYINQVKNTYDIYAGKDSCKCSFDNVLYMDLVHAEKCEVLFGEDYCEELRLNYDTFSCDSGNVFYGLTCLDDPYATLSFSESEVRSFNGKYSMFDTEGKMYLYIPKDDRRGIARFVPDEYHGNSFFTNTIQYLAECSNGVITMTDDNGKIKKFPGTRIDIQSCIECHRNVKYDFEIIELLEGTEDIYIVKKEGYYGVVKLDIKKEGYFGYYSKDENGKCYDIGKHLTPFAFTGYRQFEEQEDDKLFIEEQEDDKLFIIVERFGKKGVFELTGEKYVIPCEYEEITYHKEFYSEFSFIVKKAGFEGIIDKNGNWVKPLHRTVE